MLSVVAGNTVNLDATIRGTSGALADPSAVTLVVTNSSAAVILTLHLSDLVRLSVGSYRYPWATSSSLPVDLYTATWYPVVVAGSTLPAKAEGIAVYAPGTITLPEPTSALVRGPYVTPASYRTRYLGSPLTGVSDLQLAAVLGRASTIADGYCSVPLIPQRHDFRGGTIIGERQSWRLPDGGAGSASVGQRRAYPYHWPVKVVQGFKIYVSNTSVALDIPASEIIIQNSERYLEVVTLIGATFGLFNAITTPNVFLATPTVRLDYTYGVEERHEQDLLFPENDARLIWRAQNQWWLVDLNNTVDLYVNGSLVPSGYTVDPIEGRIIFGSQPVAGAAVTASYTSRLQPEVRDAVSLIARFELGESKLAAKGMQGVESVKMAELEITRSRVQRSGTTVNEHNLASLVPEAADLLDGLKFFRMAA